MNIATLPGFAFFFLFSRERYLIVFKTGKDVYRNFFFLFRKHESMSNSILSLYGKMLFFSQKCLELFSRDSVLGGFLDSQARVNFLQFLFHFINSVNNGGCNQNGEQS